MDAVILPDAPWRNRPGLDTLFRALGHSEARFVGGAVRDTLLGIDVADVDVATRHTPEEVVERLREATIRVVPTGIAHGTVTAVLDSGPVEVTTLRRDVATDGRHATVAFTNDWQADAARRDFTINALYADPTSGAIHDYFGGLDDLVARRVRFIGDPLKRIAEDHLRILRFFRFLARFGDSPDADGLAACIARANDLMALSRERIADELLKLMVAPRAPATLALMVDHGVLRPVLPEIDATGVASLERVARFEQATGTLPSAIRRLAALLPRDPALGDAIGARLRMSKAHRKRLAIALDPSPVTDPRAIAYRVGTESAQDRLFLSSTGLAEVTMALARLTDWTPPALPVSGGALVERGMARGKDVATTLHAIEDQWIAEGFPDAARVAAIADAAVDQALRSPRN